MFRPDRLVDLSSSRFPSTSPSRRQPSARNSAPRIYISRDLCALNGPFLCVTPMRTVCLGGRDAVLSDCNDPLVCVDTADCCCEPTTGSSLARLRLAPDLPSSLESTSRRLARSVTSIGTSPCQLVYHSTLMCDGTQNRNSGEHRSKICLRKTLNPVDASRVNHDMSFWRTAICFISFTFTHHVPHRC